MTAALLFAGCLVLLAAFLWAERASNLAQRQRLAVIDYIYSQPDFAVLNLEFDAVSFERHYRALLFRRDPAALYSPRLAAAMTGASA